MTYLDDVLEQRGFAHRPQQDALFEHLRSGDAVISQAGTGTGKSLAVLSAALHRFDDTGRPALIVCPTNILLDQYAHKDGPAFSEATGGVVRTLKGRRHYLCSSSDGVLGGEAPRDLMRRLTEPGPVEVTDSRFGCPGFEECDEDGVCHYRTAKALLKDAEVIITNAHLLILDAQFKAKAEKQAEDLGRKPGGEGGIFPPLSAVYVDEAHTFEEVARGFTESSISLKTVETMLPYGAKLALLMRQWQRSVREPKNVGTHLMPWVGEALTELSKWHPEPGARKSQRRTDAADAAYAILQAGKRGIFADGHRVLWFDPRPDDRSRIVGTDINLAAMCRRILTAQPFALVSATVPRTMAGALGVPEAAFIDVGHPFDYARQARLGFSSYPGDWNSAKNVGNRRARADELRDLVLARGGGALLLFSAYNDLNEVYEWIGPALRRAGLLVLRQERDSDKQSLGDAFKADGNAVLFGSSSFATGFDCPGPALRTLALWKLPYPGLNPVTRAIASSSRRRYEDMMLVQATQGLGRGVRTETDEVAIWVCDSRGRSQLLRDEPMTAHLLEMAQI